MADDNDQELAYYEQLLNDIRDIKARVWNFITILVVITGGVLAIDNNDLNDIRELLGFVIIIAASATFFISIDSFIKLGDVRKKLNNFLKNRNMKVISDQRENNKNDDGTIYDAGDFMFLVLGILSTLISILIVLQHFY